MSAPNSAMAIHRLIPIVDRFSLHCNSIQSPVSIVHLRVILTYLIPLLRVYINQHSSNAIQFSSNLYSNVTTSTRINSSSVHTYIFVCFIRNYIACNSTRVCWPKMQHPPPRKLKFRQILGLWVFSVTEYPPPRKLKFRQILGLWVFSATEYPPPQKLKCRQILGLWVFSVTEYPPWKLEI